MTVTTREWVSKAEGDFDFVTLARRSRKKSRYDGVCFHCQQCVEKYLKARLNEDGIAFPRTHDLVALLALIAPAHPLWLTHRPAFARLNQAAVLMRYPGATATPAHARDAYNTCRRFREDARTSLGL